MTYILGLNAYHGDSAACLLKDGQLLAAAEEERFRRVKHWAGFPREAIRFCLNEVGIEIKDVEHIAINRNKKANLKQKAYGLIQRKIPVTAIRDHLKRTARTGLISHNLIQNFGKKDPTSKAKVHAVEHHVAHLTSTFNVSPFDTAAIVSVDGFGDYVGAMWGIGTGNKIAVKEKIYFPHSLGIFYTALTQFGFIFDFINDAFLFL